MTTKTLFVGFSLISTSASITNPRPPQLLQKSRTPLEIASVASALIPGKIESLRCAGDILRRLGKELSSQENLLNPDTTRNEIFRMDAFDVLLGCLETPNESSKKYAAHSSHQSEASEISSCVRALTSLSPLPQPTNRRVFAIVEKLVTSGDPLSPVDLSGLKWWCLSAGLVPPTKLMDAIATLELSGALPFRVLPRVAQGMVTVEELVGEVKFEADDVRTASGALVKERRLTAWQVDDVAAVGPFLYSGKAMPPTLMSPAVARVRDAVAAATGVSYDCVLLNLYPEGSSAMRYHSDPDQGTLWGFDTAVVSVGETRRFNFRRIGGLLKGARGDNDNEEEVHSFRVFDGDVTHMFGNCQSTFQHAIMRADVPSASMRNGRGNDTGVSPDTRAAYSHGPRVSLVFKQSLAAPGQWGHL